MNANRYIFRILLILLGVVATSCTASVPTVIYGASKFRAERVFDDPLILKFIEYVLRGEYDAADALLKAGLDVNAPGKSGLTPLWWVACAEDERAFKYILSRKGRLDIVPKVLPNIMGLLAAKGTTRLLEIALARGGAVDLPDESGERTPIFYAIEENNWSMICFLLEKGANINYRYGRGATPLVYATYVRGGDFKLAWKLIEKGADVDVPQRAGRRLADFLMAGNTTAARERWRSKIKDYLEARGEKVVPKEYFEHLSHRENQ